MFKIANNNTISTKTLYKNLLKTFCKTLKVIQDKLCFLNLKKWEREVSANKDKLFKNQT